MRRVFLNPVCVLMSCLLALLAAGAALALLGDFYADIFMRAGAASTPSRWIGALTALGQGFFLVSALWDRLDQGAWFWE